MILLRVLVQTVFLAMGQIWANKVRSILTTLGIIIGVGSILSVVAALDGLRQNVLKEFETFGAKKVFIDGTLPRSQWSTGRWREVQLKLFEVEALREHCPSIAKLTPHWYGNHTIASPDKTLQSVQVVGIWPEWHEIENRHVIYGRQFMSIDEDERRNVCLINDKAIVELGLSKDPTSDYIQIAGRRFLIVGVVETKDVGPMFGGGDVMTEVFVPTAGSTTRWASSAAPTTSRTSRPKSASSSAARATWAPRTRRPSRSR
jgi:putative ABC transport system permease protein